MLKMLLDLHGVGGIQTHASTKRREICNKLPVVES